MIDRDIIFLFLGACFGLVSAVIGTIVQHVLSLRADKIKRERDMKEQEENAVRKSLIQGVETIKPEDMATLKMILQRLSPLIEKDAGDSEQKQNEQS